MDWIKLLFVFISGIDMGLLIAILIRDKERKNKLKENYYDKI